MTICLYQHDVLSISSHYVGYVAAFVLVCAVLYVSGHCWLNQLFYSVFSTFHTKDSLTCKFCTHVHFNILSVLRAFTLKHLKL